MIVIGQYAYCGNGRESLPQLTPWHHVGYVPLSRREIEEQIPNTLCYYLNLLDGMEKCRFSEGDITLADINLLVI
jgi:hypothetical protein